mgnify:CR=1 FL=1
MISCVRGAICKFLGVCSVTRFWNIKENLQDDELLGALIVEKALNAPIRRIATNAGQNGAIITEKIKNSEFKIGYDAATNQFLNMYEKGIIDPAKVTRSTVQNAASIAARFTSANRASSHMSAHAWWMPTHQLGRFSHIRTTERSSLTFNLGPAVEIL